MIDQLDILYEGAYVDDHGLNCYGIYIDSITQDPHCLLLFFDVSTKNS